MMKEITIEIIQKCPNNCIYCSSMSNKNSRNILKLKDIINVMRDAKELGFTHVNISGGEPFLHPDIESIITMAKQFFKTVFIYTSGIYIENEQYLTIPDYLLNTIKEEEIDKLIFNVQAPNKSTNLLITGVEEKYNNTECRDLSISNAITKDIPVEINVVPMKLNLSHLEHIVKKAILLKCKKINFLKLVIQGTGFKNRELIELDEEEEIILQETLYRIEKDYGEIIRIGTPLQEDSSKKCNAGTGKIVVKYNGDVYPCEAFKYLQEFDGEKPLNIKDAALNEIINTGFIQNLKYRIMACKHDKCSDCPAQHIILKTDHIIEEDDIKKMYSLQTEEIFNNHLKDSMSLNGFIMAEDQFVPNNIYEKFFEENVPLNKTALDNNTNFLMISGRTPIMFGINPVYTNAESFNFILEGFGILNKINQYQYDVQLNSIKYTTEESNHRIIPLPIFLTENISDKRKMELLRNWFKLIDLDSSYTQTILITRYNYDYLNELMGEFNFSRIRAVGYYVYKKLY